MKLSRLKAILKKARRVRIAVIGDFCLDAYWDLGLSRSETSLETGLLTRPIRRQRYSPGGAGNLAAGLAALGCGRVLALGVLGEDPWAGELRRSLKARGAEVSGLLTQPRNWATPVYVKPMAGPREMNRFDAGGFNGLSRATGRALLRRLETLLPGLDAVIINQQLRNSLHAPWMRAALAGLILRHPAKLFLTDARHDGASFPGSVHKINAREALRLCGLRGSAGSGTVRQAASRLHKRFKKPVFITRGARGCLLCDSRGIIAFVPPRVRGQIDPVGGGDSVMAGISLALAAGADPRDAMELGSLAAAITVRKLGQTGWAEPKEILKISKRAA